MYKKVILLAHGKSFLCYSHSDDDIVKTLDSFKNTCEFINKIEPDHSYKQYLKVVCIKPFGVWQFLQLKNKINFIITFYHP